MSEETIFCRAMQMPTHERAAFLDEACESEALPVPDSTTTEPGLSSSWSVITLMLGV